MKQVALHAEARILSGRKVKQVRKQGLIPANIFGRNTPSRMISVSAEEFGKVFTQAGETTVLSLELDGAHVPVLIKNVQVHPVDQHLIHIDFYQVDLTKKVKANIPVKIQGTAPAVVDNLGVLLELTRVVEVEALPTELPDHILVDVSKLQAVGNTVKISDITLPKGVTVLTNATLELVKIGVLISKEAEELVKTEAAAAAAAQAVSAATGTPATEKGTPAAPATSAPEDAKKEEKKTEK